MIGYFITFFTGFFAGFVATIIISVIAAPSFEDILPKKPTTHEEIVDDIANDFKRKLEIHSN